MEDAIDEDIRRWRQIAEERMRGLNDGRDNLAIQLQVPYNKLAEEIKKLKDGSKNAPEGPIKEFLLHALSDYRVSRTITSMAIAADVCFMVDCTVRRHLECNLCGVESDRDFPKNRDR